MNQRKCQAVIDKFQSLLRSGKDYSVDYMYTEAGDIAFIGKKMAQVIVNNYYKAIINQEMIDYVKEFKTNKARHLKKDCIKSFARKFNVCDREGRLLIRYVRRR